LYGSQSIDGRTKVWASGLDSWKALSSVPQLKWHIIAEKQPGLLDESKLAKTVLDILIRVVSFCPAKIGDAVIRPVHKAKQVLSDPGGCLAHIVQVLLTFDPEIVERVAQLLALVRNFTFNCWS
jgi:DnaJ family protein C protein 13